MISCQGTIAVQGPNIDEKAVQQHPDLECQFLINKDEKSLTHSWTGPSAQHLCS